jgi:predicted nucleotidyltransferase
LEIYTKRAQQADARIEQLRTSLAAQLKDLPVSSDHPSLCIYATGSLARREATEHSDLDAFFLLSGDENEKPLGRIRDVRILNAVLNAQEEAGFPDFSNDGAYLKFLYIDDVVKCIGHRDDDYKNAFTARILLLTESCYLFNNQNFECFKDKIVDIYFQDFHNHSNDFRPIFLLNDILRFWRTLCLNYENARHWREDEDEIKRAKGHLDNLKLKFSRLNICYSYICHLMSQGPALTRDNALITSNLTPFERLNDIEYRYENLAPIIGTMKNEYAWFLETTDKPKLEMLDWISKQENRDEAFRHAGIFVNNMGELVKSVAEQNGYLRYLIV